MAGGMPAGRRRARRGMALTGAMVALAILWLVPVVWVFVTSLKLTPNIIRS